MATLRRGLLVGTNLCGQLRRGTQAIAGEIAGLAVTAKGALAVRLLRFCPAETGVTAFPSRT